MRPSFFFLSQAAFSSQHKLPVWRLAGSSNDHHSLWSNRRLINKYFIVSCCLKASNGWLIIKNTPFGFFNGFSLLWLLFNVFYLHFLNDPVKKTCSRSSFHSFILKPLDSQVVFSQLTCVGVSVDEFIHNTHTHTHIAQLPLALDFTRSIPQRGSQLWVRQHPPSSSTLVHCAKWTLLKSNRGVNAGDWEVTSHSPKWELHAQTRSDILSERLLLQEDVF